MKRALLLFLLASLVTPAVAQNGGNVEVGRVSFEALSQQREGSLLRCGLSFRHWHSRSTR